MSPSLSGPLAMCCQRLEPDVALSMMVASVSPAVHIILLQSSGLLPAWSSGPTRQHEWFQL